MQSCTISTAIIGLVLAIIALSPLLKMFVNFSTLDMGVIIPAFLIILQIFLVGFILLKRRRQYRKKYKQKFLQTTELGLSEERLNLHSRIIHGGCVTNSMLWSDITSIEFGHSNLEDGGNHLLFRDTTGNTIDLQLEYIQTIEERNLLKECIFDFVRHIDTRAVTSGLLKVGRKDDVPFTRLWCQALTDSRPRINDAPLLPETSLQEGRFRIIALIGGGGQGTVYTAEMAGLEGVEQVVLKEYVLPDFSHQEEHKNACEQFEKEIRLLSKVDHEGVIKLIDAFVEDHRAYLVLDFVDGVSLRQHIEKQGPLPQEQVVRLAIQMCDILDYLHHTKPCIMHLDFSPENILYQEESDRITLIDFNISVEENSIRTRTVMGKQRYMAPEQYRGRPTPLSDIYSLGATLFYLFTGREPEPISVAHPQKHNRQIDTALDEIVARATAMEEDDRYQSATQLKTSLEQWMK
ncbi:MAG: serine/threonine protein kinase [Candidatus Obscuribacterales bacterium]|nr:serine/threonine protein kinase [Candidatus Obscuribacterales bacterium]